MLEALAQQASAIAVASIVERNPERVARKVQQARQRGGAEQPPQDRGQLAADAGLRGLAQGGTHEDAQQQSAVRCASREEHAGDKTPQQRKPLA